MKHNNTITSIEKLFRYLQLGVSLAVISLYSQDLDTTKPLPPKWLYAVITGCISCTSAAGHLILAWKHSIEGRVRWYLPLFIYEVIVVILWVIVVAIFGNMYIKNTEGEGNPKFTRMQKAVWVDMVNLIFWSITAVLRGITWRKGRWAPRGGRRGGHRV
jgi:hypothetical protein